MGAFEKTELLKSDVIDSILANFEDGSKTNFILNILLLTGLDGWRTKEMKQLVEMFENFMESEYLENRMMLSYNPMMSIVLTAEILRKIANAKKLFRDKCNNMATELLEFGKMY